jgi:serine/threonine protein phosphatase PrpC
MSYEIIIGGHHTKSYKDKENPEKKCEDYHLIKSNEDQQIYVFSVADGAGSSQFSDIGAKVVCEKICNLMYNNFDLFFDSDPFIAKRKIIHTLRTHLGIEARKKHTKIDEFASTLLFVAIKKNRIIAGHIGDGLIAYKKNNILEILSPPENGEFTNLTYFVTSKYYLHHLRLYKGGIDDIKAIYLLTDGIANIFYSRKQKEILKSFETISKALEGKNSQELGSTIKKILDNNISKRTNDDSTLVAAFLKETKI